MTATNKHTKKAAEKSVDDDRTLPGEDPATDRLEDVFLWMNVYRELLAFKESLLRVTEESMQSMNSRARDEVGETDAVVLRAEADRFRRRLDYWRARRDALTGAVGAPEADSGPGGAATAAG